MSREETTNKIQNEGILTVEWCIDDVREKCPLLDDEECKEVLKYMYDIFAYDNYGIIVGADAIVWPLIDNSINDCFPEKWDKYSEVEITEKSDKYNKKEHYNEEELKCNG